MLSSKIEGTQATTEEVLEHEAGGVHDEQKTGDIREILNYRKALKLAGNEVQDQPITLALVRATHQILMSTVRGQDNSPGEFRPDQNWIGGPGSTIESATFVPPHPLQLPGHLRNWELYLKAQDFDPLAQTAIVHAQFELLHPFRDGNGRMGRMLIPLFLYSKKVLSSPVFYLSEYLEATRDEYYTRLQAISKNNDWTGWIAFFLRAVTAQAETNVTRVQAIVELYHSMKKKVPELARSMHSAQMVDALFKTPIFSVADFANRAGIPSPTAHTLIRQLRETDVLKVQREASGRRRAIYIFSDLLNLCQAANFSASP